MSIAELLQRAEFLVDAKGAKKAVVLDYTIWEELLTMLEDLEDADEIRRLRKAGEESLPWEQAKASLRTEGVNVWGPPPARMQKGHCQPARRLCTFDRSASCANDPPPHPIV